MAGDGIYSRERFCHDSFIRDEYGARHAQDLIIAELDGCAQSLQGYIKYIEEHGIWDDVQILDDFP